MTTPAHHLQTRLRYAITFWQEYIQQDPLPPLDRWLSQTLKNYRAFGKQDRRWYSDILFAATRFAYLSASLLRPPQPYFKDAPELLATLRQLDAREILRHTAQRYRHDSPELEWPRELIDDPIPSLAESAHDHDIAHATFWQGIPDFYGSHLQQRATSSQWDDKTLRNFIEGQSTRPPLWLRVNHSEHYDAILAELAQHGFEASPHADAIKVLGNRSLYELATYKNGSIEIQDLASQLAGDFVATQPGQRAWDACAGGGGKTMQIAARLANRGAVLATDIREYKLDEIRRRAKRASFHNIRCQQWDGQATPALPREISKQNGFDWVLVDAPCSGSGTWRRNPDAKLRFDLTTLPNLTDLQYMLLKNAAPAVRPGGHLVYATCSWLCAENEDIINTFLAQHPEFQLENQQLLGWPQVDADTLYAAALKRSS